MTESQRLQYERAGELRVEELEGQSLKRRIGGAAHDVLAPGKAAANGGLRHDSPHDEYAAQVVQEDVEASSPEQGAHLPNELSDSEEFAQRGAGVEEVVG